MQQSVRSVEESNRADVESTMIDRREAMHVDLVTFAPVEIEDFKSDAGRRETDVLQSGETNIFDLAADWHDGCVAELFDGLT